MTSFDALDPVLRQWSIDNALPLATEYRGEAVRSFEVVGRSRRAQIWVEPTQPLSVHVWDYETRRECFRGDRDQLVDRLDDALAVARSWVSP